MSYKILQTVQFLGTSTKPEFEAQAAAFATSAPHFRRKNTVTLNTVLLHT